MIEFLWLVYLIWFTDNTREPGIENREAFFPVALGNFFFEPAPPVRLPPIWNPGL